MLQLSREKFHGGKPDSVPRGDRWNAFMALQTDAEIERRSPGITREAWAVASYGASTLQEAGHKAAHGVPPQMMWRALDDDAFWVSRLSVGDRAKLAQLARWVLPPRA